MVTLSLQKQFMQENLIPLIREHWGYNVTEKDEKVLMILEIVKFEKIFLWPFSKVGRKPKDRIELARAFISKAVCNISRTKFFIEFLVKNDVIRKACGWEFPSDIPSESKFSRVFSYFAEIDLGQTLHESLIKNYIPETTIIGHLSRDSSAVESREKVETKKKEEEKPSTPKKRGRPKKGEERPPKEKTRLEKQKDMSLSEMLEDLPKECDFGSKKNSKGKHSSWCGYKLHADFTDEGIPVSCILTSASLYDNQVALPLCEMSSKRVTALYELMDAAYDCEIIKNYSKAKGHVPIIDMNPRRGEKIEFTDPERERYKERTTVERGFSDLKDNHAVKDIRVKGHKKVFLHIMFGVIALTAKKILMYAEKFEKAAA